MARGGKGVGRPQMPSLLRFGAIFRALPFPAPPCPPRSLLTLFAHPLPFHPVLPLPNEVNKKLSHRGQNALSVRKTHGHNTDCIYPYVSLDWPDAQCSQHVPSSVRLSVLSFVCERYTSKTNEHISMQIGVTLPGTRA